MLDRTQPMIPGMAWQRACSWLTLDRLISSISILIIGLASATTGFQSDTWWNLRSGQLTWQSGFVWMTDPLSSTAYGNYWPNHEWLTQIIFYAVTVATGLGGLVMLMALLTILTWLCIDRLCSGPGRYRALILLLGVPGHVIVWAIRPHMLTLLFLALLLLLIQRPRLHRAIPLLFLLWANMHGGFTFGGVALVIAAGIHVMFDQRSLRHWVAVIGASAVATLLTPLGPALWLFSFSMLNHAQTTYIQEWLPPSLSWPVSYPFFVLALIWSGLVLRQWRYFRQCLIERQSWPILLLLLGLLFLLLGFRAIRHTALFTLVALPLISHLLLHNKAVPASETDWRRGMAHAGMIILFGLAGIGGVRTVWQSDTMSWQPLTSAAISAVRGCRGTLYNDYALGGAVLWFIPERPVFIDSRNDPYPLDLLYAAAFVEQQGQYQELFKRYNVRCVLVRSHSAGFQAISQDSIWHERYRDSSVAVLAAEQ